MREQIDDLNNRAWALVDSDIKQASALAKEARALAMGTDESKPDFEAGYAYSLRTLGYLNQRLGDYSLGIRQLSRSQEICEKLGLEDGLIDVLDGLAGIYFQIGEFAESLTHSSKMVELAQRIGDQARVANANNNLAVLYYDTGELDKCIEAHLANLDLATKIGYERVVCLANVNLADAYLIKGDLELALRYARQGLALSQHAGLVLFEAYAQNYSGNIQLQLGNLDQALDHLNAALALSAKIDTPVTRTLVLLDIAKAYRARKQLDQARKFAKESLAIAAEIDARSELIAGHLLLAEIEEEIGDAPAALSHFKLYQATREAVLGDKANQRLQVLQVAHDTESARQEAEIARLKTAELQLKFDQQIRSSKQLQRQLERLVQKRTAELSQTVDLLQGEIQERQRAEEEVHQMVAVLEERVAERSRELAALYEMTILLTDAGSMNEMLNPALRNICNSVGCSGIAIHLLSADRSHLLLSDQLHLGSREELKEVAISPDFSVWLGRGYPPTMFTGQPNARVALPEALLLADFPTYFGTVLHVSENAIGLLSVYREQASVFEVEEVSLLIMMAEQLSIIIQNYRLQQQAQQMTRAIERQDLARKLHDSVAQRLYSLGLFARAGQDAVEDGDLATARTRLQQVKENAVYSLREMRLLLYQMRPMALEGQNLIEAIAERFQMVEERLGIATRMEAQYRPTPGPLSEEHLYYAVMEALNNALRHANATSVVVSVARVADDLLLTIVDDGCGFDTTSATSGQGLGNMQSHIAELGGRLAIDSKPDQGTRVQISVKLEALV